MMIRGHILHISALLLLIAFASCSEDGDVVYVPDPSDQLAGKPNVFVLYDPGSLGDRSYNDMIYKGAENAARRCSLRINHVEPSSVEEGESHLEYIIDNLIQSADTSHNLLVVASQSYDTFVRANSKRLEKLPNTDLLYLESRTPLKDKGSTLYLPYYGAMYEAGIMTAVISTDAMIIASNDKNESVSDAVRGFSDGFNSETAVGLLNRIMPGYYEEYGTDLIVRYLSEELSGGYVISVPTAIKILYDDYKKGCCVVPICGGAGNTIARIIETLGDYMYMGVDKAVPYSSRCHYSAVKHIDQAVEESIYMWAEEGSIPKHQSLGLDTGFTGTELHIYNTFTRDFIQSWLTDEVLSDIHEEACEKEREYESLF